MSNLFDQVKQLPLSETVSQYTDLTSHGGGHFRGRCPIHGSDNDSVFAVNDNNGLWYCHSGECGGGSVIEFLMKVGAAADPWSAVTMVASAHGIEVPDHDDSPPTHDDLLHAADVFCTTVRFDNTAEKYCADRGLDPAVMKKWGVGMVPDTNVVLSRFRDEGVKLAALMELGYASESFGSTLVKARGRLLFPIVNGDITVGYSARYIDGVTPGKQDAKYVNSPASEVYNKSVVLFGSQNLSDATRRVVVVEGQIDAIVAHEACHGEDRSVVAVAALGSTFTSGQFDRMMELAPHVEEVTLLFDNDDAGVKATSSCLWMSDRVKVTVPRFRVDNMFSDVKSDVADMGAAGDDIAGMVADRVGLADCLLNIVEHREDPQEWYDKFAGGFSDAVARDQFIRAAGVRGVSLRDTVEYSREKFAVRDNPYLVSIAAELLRIPPALRAVVWHRMRGVFGDMFGLFRRDLDRLGDIVLQSSGVVSDVERAEMVSGGSAVRGTLATQVAARSSVVDDTGVLPVIAAFPPSVGLTDDMLVTVWFAVSAVVGGCDGDDAGVTGEGTDRPVGSVRDDAPGEEWDPEEQWRQENGISGDDEVGYGSGYPDDIVVERHISRGRRRHLRLD